MPTLLLVEDNEMNRDVLGRLLARRGYRVVVAEDGEAAVRMALGEAPDLVLMDISLPIVDGYEATRRIRAAGSSVPIIALTAHALTSDRDRALAAGCTDYEAKPVELQRLLQKIQNHLQESQA
ncbi:MAG: Polar-differentiation response regulator DivK [Acidobacteria bacterium ADurb.Bin340]|nr:MAG: Polar-differentiation response regulator DivK [Acidobacteria bacterium ADurb.Bin340]HOD33372.1 response regulator [Holophaga sp.]HQL47868.1 response regulator [Holophaga sp.]